MNKVYRIALLSLSACLAACSSSTPTEPSAKEIPSSEKVNIDASQAALFDVGTKLYQKELFSIAKDSFESLRNGYPVGPYAEFSEVKLADCYYASSDYDAAAVLYETFLKDHPASKTSPYMTFQAARSYQLSSGGVGRDTAPLEKAVDYYSRVLQQFPDSVYALSAAEHKKETQRQLALNEERVLDFYRRQEKNGAYQVRSQEFARTWQPILDSQSEGESSATLGSQDTAPKNSQEIQPNLSAPEMLVVQRAELLSPEERRQTAESAAGKPLPASAKLETVDSALPAISGIHHVQCVTGQTKAVFLYLSDPELLQQSSALLGSKAINPSEGRITFSLPPGKFEPISRDCFGQNDLQIGKDGVVALEINAPVTLLTLDNPPRVVIVLGENS